MKKGKRLLCGALALLLVLSLTAVATVQRAYATKSEEDQAAEEQKKAEEAAQRQAEMDELERKKQEKKDRIAALQKQIADAKSKKENVMGTKTLLDQRNQLLMEEIDDTKAQIDLYAEQIQVYQEMEEEQYALFCQQVRSEEERGSLSYWSVLFKATSISDLLSRLEFVNEVAEYDRSLMEAIRQTRENIKTEKAAMEEQEQLLAQQQDELQKKVDEAAAWTSAAWAPPARLWPPRAARSSSPRPWCTAPTAAAATATTWCWTTAAATPRCTPTSALCPSVWATW